MGEIKQALAVLQPTNPLVVYRKPQTTQQQSRHGSLVDYHKPPSSPVGSGVDQSNPPLPEQASSLPVDIAEPLTTMQAIEPLEQSASSLPIANSELLEPMPEMPVNYDEPLVEEPAEVEAAIAVDSSPVATSELLVDEPATSEPLEEEAIAPAESPHLTRNQLGQMLGGKTRETIRKWEESGKLSEKGWEPVPGTGSSPANPRLYRPIV